MRKILFFSLFLFQVSISWGQFSQKQKEAVKELMTYPNVNYSFNINFSTADYVAPFYPHLDLYELSVEQLEQKLQNSYKDAPIYGRISALFYQKKERLEAEKYFSRAIPLFKEWQLKEPQNMLPYLYMIDYLWSVETYPLLQETLQELSQNFPNEKVVIAKNFEFSLFIKNDVETAQNYLETFEKLVEPNNLTLLIYKQNLLWWKFLLGIKENPAKASPSDFSFAEVAYKTNPSSVAHGHFYYYCVTASSYENMAKRILHNSQKNRNDNNYLQVLREKDKNRIKLLKEAERFFLKNLDKAPKIQQTYILNNLGVVYIYLGEAKKSIECFEKAWQIEKNKKFLEAAIFVAGADRQWSDAEKYLQLVLSENPQDLQHLAMLVVIYSVKKPNPELLKKYITQIEQIGSSDELRSGVLAVWNIKQNNLERAEFYLNLLPESSGLFYRMVLSVLKDDMVEAKKYFQKLFAENKEDKNLLKAKQILNF